MKKAIICALCLAAAAPAALQAQEEVVVAKTETTVVEPARQKVVTNGFWDNWFIQAGAGAQILFSDHDKQAKFGDRITPSIELGFGKWFSPVIGVRANINGYNAKGVTQNGESLETGKVLHATHLVTPYKPLWADGDKMWKNGWLYKQEFKYYNIQLDVMIDLCNWIGGYNPDRLYRAIPYLGVGYAHVCERPQADEFTMNVGLQNAFRVNKHLDVNLNINTMIADDRFTGENGNRHFDAILGVTAGVTYRFNQTGWSTPISTTTTTYVYDNEGINNMRRQVADLEAENQRLREQAARNRVTELIASGNIIFFKLDSYEISEMSRTNLKFLAQAIKDSNAKYTVTGYADKGTGTPEYNEALSQKRAEAARNVLVDEFGVPADRLVVDYKGGVEDMFYNDPRLSRCVIVLPEE